MKATVTIGTALVLALFAAAAAHAQGQPQGTPTGVCKDGSNWYGATKKGACSHHGGVKTWSGPQAAAGGSAAPAPSTAPAAAPAPAAPAPAPAPARAAPAAPAATSGSAAAAAPGGGPGLVWVNTASKVYHCSGTRYYGKTKAGKYVTEAAAKAEGDRPDHGKPCS